MKDVVEIRFMANMTILDDLKISRHTTTALIRLKTNLLKKLWWL